MANNPKAGSLERDGKRKNRGQALMPQGICTESRRVGVGSRNPWQILAVLMMLVGASGACLSSPYHHNLRAGAGPQKVDTTKNLVGFVDPFIGTDAGGNTIPAVGLPFGMTQWTPQTCTSEEKCEPPYVYTDTVMSGFRGSHWLSGSCTQDYGSFTLMPITGKLTTSWAEYQTAFSHDDELSMPYYYRVGLPRYRLVAELTATERCAMMRFTAERSGDFYLLITPNSDRKKGYVKIDPAQNEIVGYNPAYRIYQGAGEPAGFSGYFAAQVMKPFDRWGTFSEGHTFSNDSMNGGEDIGAYVHYRVTKGEQILVRIGTSFTSIDEARKNLKVEIPAWNFDGIRDKARATWEKALNRISVTDGSSGNERIFYTALYHTMQQPRMFSDVDGTYPAFSKQYETARLDSGHYYDDFSMWDIFRAEIPLYELLSPSLVNDWVRSFILKGDDGGWLPIFPCWNNYTSEMIGDHSIAFIASAYNKGIRNYDVLQAYGLMRKNAFDIPDAKDYADGKGRRALPSYLRYGYVPLEDHVPFAFHSNEQVSRTLEYAFDDYSLATVADSLGKMSDYRTLMKRAKNYRNVFDSSIGMVRGRHMDGSWAADFNPDKRESYITEGTPRQWSFYVPQDIPGLAALMGGRARMEEELDSLFTGDNYNPGNEPDQQAPFMYDYTPHPWKTQLQVRRILHDDYSDGPAGLPGNDDAGEMSAWYVFAALGFYPVNPVSNDYLLSSPLFGKIEIRIGGNTPLHIVTHKVSSTSKYIYKVEWNGKPLLYDYISFGSLLKGGTLEFFLGDQPSNWGSKKGEQPAGL